MSQKVHISQKISIHQAHRFPYKYEDIKDKKKETSLLENFLLYHPMTLPNSVKNDRTR